MTEIDYKQITQILSLILALFGIIPNVIGAIKALPFKPDSHDEVEVLNNVVGKLIDRLLIIWGNIYPKIAESGKLPTTIEPRDFTQMEDLSSFLTKYKDELANNKQNTNHFQEVASARKWIIVGGMCIMLSVVLQIVSNYLNSC